MNKRYDVFNERNTYTPMKKVHSEQETISYFLIHFAKQWDIINNHFDKRGKIDSFAI